MSSVVGARLMKRQLTKFPESEIGKIVSNVARASIDSVNYLSELDKKYQWSKTFQQWLDKAVALNEQYDFRRIAETAAETVEVGLSTVVDQAVRVAEDYQLIENL